MSKSTVFNSTCIAEANGAHGRHVILVKFSLIKNPELDVSKRRIVVLPAAYDELGL